MLNASIPTSLPRRTAALAGVALIAAVAGCGGGGSGGVVATASTTGGGKQSAADFIRQVTIQFSLGQTGRLWDTLHPADQAVVSRARYTACERNEGFGLQKFKVLDTYADPVDIAGTSVASTAVSVQVTADDGVTTATMHATQVNGSWRWTLAPADLAAYRQGKCPSA